MISAARINLVIHFLSTIQQPSQRYYLGHYTNFRGNFLNRFYISVLKRQTVTCSHDILTHLLAINRLSKSIDVKYMYDTVYYFVVTWVCKRCYNFPFYYTGVVQCLEHIFIYLIYF